MTTEDTPPFPAPDLCARRVLAMALGAELAARPPRAADAPPPVDHAALWRRLHRAPGAPVDLATERALNSHTAWRAAYRAMLGPSALATSPVAAAASGGTAVHRRIGAYALRLDETTGDDPHVVSIRIPAGEPAPAALEILSEDGLSIRLDLGPPIDGTILLVLFPDNATHAAVHAALRSPLAALYLVPGPAA